MCRTDQMTTSRRQTPIAELLNAGTLMVWACVCYSNGRTDRSLWVWGLSLGGEIGGFLPVYSHRMIDREVP